MVSGISIHTFMHVPFERLGCIEPWIIEKGHSITFTRFYEEYTLPNPDEIDWLIVMGGPMGVYDNVQYPWLNEEKEFIKQVILKGKTVLGICLGSQLIASALGAKVYPNKQKEIGWYNLNLTEQGRNHPLFIRFETEFPVFHWHGDTFDLPAGSVHLASSNVCRNQAFLFNDKVLGLQFHFEVTSESLNEMIENGRNELMESETIQQAEQIRKQTGFIETNNGKMFRILDYLAR